MENQDSLRKNKWEKKAAINNWQWGTSAWAKKKIHKYVWNLAATLVTQILLRNQNKTKF